MKNFLISTLTCTSLALFSQVGQIKTEEYKAKFEQVTPMLSAVLDVALPDAGFYLWAGVPGGDDESFAKDLLAQYNVTVLPGRYLAREVNGINPGQGRIRMALVAQPQECLEAARRIVQFVQNNYSSST